MSGVGGSFSVYVYRSCYYFYMRNAYILIGIGAIIIAVGSWFLVTSNTSNARNMPEASSTDVREMPPVPISETQGAAIGEENSVDFTCAGGKSMIAIFTRDILALTLSDGRQVTLRQAESGSGISYLNAAASIEFRGKGDEALLQENGATTYSGCTPN